jgi:ribosomal protein L19E
VKAIIVSNDSTKGDLTKAINSFKDTMRQVTGMSTGRLEQRQVGAVHGRNQGHGGGRGRDGGRHGGRGGRNKWHRGRGG